MTKEGAILVTLMSITMALVLTALIYFRCRYTAQKERIQNYLDVARSSMEINCNRLATACTELDTHTSFSSMAIATSLRGVIKEEFDEMRQEIGTGLDECFSIIDRRFGDHDQQQSSSGCAP